MSVQDDVSYTRLDFLTRVVKRECRHLETTDQRLFATAFTVAQARQLEHDPDLAERVEAFVSRFCRLQDTLGHRLLPALLQALGEPVAAVIDNLDRAERLGWLNSTQEWQDVRQLRNQMIHEYMEDPVVLTSALQAGHESVPMLVGAATAMCGEVQKRGWLGLDGQ
ncbi:MAG: hypothetical protein L0H83_12090 [Salinisphaera sp.]|nr:hypothetical protein [Salinisphaera sp.]